MLKIEEETERTERIKAEREFLIEQVRGSHHLSMDHGSLEFTTNADLGLQLCSSACMVRGRSNFSADMLRSRVCKLGHESVV